MSKGHFIVLEGGEGVGKTTQIAHLQRALQMEGLESRALREPGGSEVGEFLRPILKGYRYPAITEWHALCGYNFSRMAFIEEFVKPTVKEGGWLLADRFAFSTIVYQGIAGGLPLDVVKAVTYGTVGDNWPSLTLILDAPPEIGLTRALADSALARQDGTRYEDKDLEFHKKVREGYRTLHAENPDKTVLIDATLPEAEVHAAILAALNSRLNLTLKPVILPPIPRAA